jgi:hypothetical protein
MLVRYLPEGLNRMITNRFVFSIALMLGLISVVGIFGDLPWWWPMGDETDPERAHMLFGLVGIPSAVILMASSITPVPAKESDAVGPRSGT